MFNIYIFEINQVTKMWVYVLIFIFIAYTLFKERQSLGCPDIPTGEDCDNANSKVVKGTSPSNTDSVPQLLDKIKFAASYNDRDVVWRRCVIYAFLSTIIYAYIIYAGFPSEYHLFCGILIIGGVFYFSYSFYKFHMRDYIKDNIYNSYDIFKSV